ARPASLSTCLGHGDLPHGLRALGCRPRRRTAPRSDGACAGRPPVCLSLRPPSDLPGPHEDLVETLEILVGVELDRDAPAASPAQDLHFRAERGAELGGDLA